MFMNIAQVHEKNMLNRIMESNKLNDSSVGYLIQSFWLTIV